MTVFRQSSPENERFFDSQNNRVICKVGKKFESKNRKKYHTNSEVYSILIITKDQ